MRIVLGLIAMAMAASAGAREDMVLLPGGTYAPFYPEKGSQTAVVASFWLDRTPVTNGQYLAFAKKFPEWRKLKAKRLFTDSHYLQSWPADLKIPLAASAEQPVVDVSWFAATAYCEALGKALPTTDQWEYALADAGRDSEKVQQGILDWYARPNRKLPKVGVRTPNGFGVQDLTGLVWEWTSDFNSFLASDDSRDGDQSALFCGGASLGSKDSRDYASFMRYSFRGSLQGRFTGKNLGFRCAMEAK